MAATIDCTNPKELLKKTPCLACLSESQLKMVLVVVLNDYLTTLRGSAAYTLPGHLGDLIKDGACYTCFSKKQLLQILVLFAGYLAYSSESTLPSIVAKGKCLPCGKTGQAESAAMRLLCQITSELQGQKD